jgi:hypothetical protein
MLRRGRHVKRLGRAVGVECPEGVCRRIVDANDPVRPDLRGQTARLTLLKELRGHPGVLIRRLRPKIRAVASEMIRERTRPSPRFSRSKVEGGVRGTDTPFLSISIRVPGSCVSPEAVSPEAVHGSSLPGSSPEACADRDSLLLLFGCEMSMDTYRPSPFYLRHFSFILQERCGGN